jgi:hypothetical protein
MAALGDQAAAGGREILNPGSECLLSPIPAVEGLDFQILQAVDFGQKRPKLLFGT